MQYNCRESNCHTCRHISVFRAIIALLSAVVWKVSTLTKNPRENLFKNLENSLKYVRMRSSAVFADRHLVSSLLLRYDTILYDTIRDAILTCARNPTWVSLIYRTESTTKKCKTEKLKSKKNRICSEVKWTVWGIHAIQSWRRKEGHGVRSSKKMFSRSHWYHCVLPGG